MIERVIENWLAKTDERAFQIAYCSVLIDQGHTVIHVSRHCAMEMGKDIITINSNGIPCAFQIKNLEGKKLNLTKYRADVEPQLLSLALQKIIHPSINSNSLHKSYLVINGELEEEVSRAIDDFNRNLDDMGQHDANITVLVKGQLYSDFTKLQEKLWPKELVDVKNYLEIYLLDGKGNLPKKKFYDLIFNSLPFNTDDLKVKDFLRAVLSGAVIVSSSISEFIKSNNHYAEFEAWIIYYANCLALAEKFNIQIAKFQKEFDFIKLTIYNTLHRLSDEVSKEKNLESLCSTNEIPLYKVKFTYLLSLLSVLGLWRKLENKNEEIDSFLKTFCNNNTSKVTFWGEFATPQFLAYYFWGRSFEASPKFDFLLYNLLQIIIQENGFRKAGTLANPYYDVDDIMSYSLGIKEEKLSDSFSGSSYSIETLMHLFIRCNWKQHMKLIWAEITKIAFHFFKPDKSWEYYLWNTKNGVNTTQIIQPFQKWDEIKKIAFESEGLEIPNLIKNSPIMYLCFLIVFPHRVNSSGVRWLASNL